MEALQLIGLALACRLDGGFSPAIQSALQSTFQSYQPRVVAFNGGGATQNAVRWVGTEGDMCVLCPFHPPTLRRLLSTLCCCWVRRQNVCNSVIVVPVARQGRGMGRWYLEHVLLQRDWSVRGCPHHYL